MAATLQKRAEQSRIKREIAENNVAAARANLTLKAYLNENLRPSRQRKMGVTIPATAERDFTNANRRQGIAMARQRIEENPIYLAIHKARMDHIVSAGYRCMMRTGDKGWDKDVEAWWVEKRDKLDIRGMRPWGKLQRCIQARHDIDGDVGGVFVTDGSRDEWVQIIEGDRIGRKVQKMPTDDGIEFDKYGMPKTFYVLDSVESPTKETPYERQDFFFYVCDPTDRAARRRGMTAYLQTFNIGEDHAETLNGMVQKVKNAAFAGLLFNLKSGNRFGEAQDETTAENGTDYTTVRMVPGTNFVLGEGEGVKMVESNTPDAQFIPFEKMLISRMAFPVNMTYELVTGDMSAMNYTTSRAMFIIVRKGLRCEQYELGCISSRIFQWKLSRAVKRGELKPPAKIKDKFWTHRWGVPGFDYMNPAQEASADKIRIETGLASRQGIMAERGDDDFDDVADELEYEKNGLEERGIPISVTPGSQTAPVAQPSDKEDDATK